MSRTSIKFNQCENDKYLDDIQANLSSKFPMGSFFAKQKNVNRFIEWSTFYRRNMHRFAQHFLGLHLHLYQIIILYFMSISPTFVLIAARAAAKSYTIAIYCCCMALLYPNTEIVIASATKGQAELIISKKIQIELMGTSPMLRREIKEVKRNVKNDLVLSFKNNSTVTIVSATENSRGNRATILVYEEFRMIPKKMLDSVLEPFLHTRNVGYASNPVYSTLIDNPISIYISSSWYQSHWLGELVKQVGIAMSEEVESKTDNPSCFLLAMDYTIPVLHKIKPFATILKAKSSADSISWRTEYENEMIRENTNAFFDYQMIEQNQNLLKAFYPKKSIDAITNKRKTNPFVPSKVDGEVRVIACDIALIKSSANDNSIYTCIRAIPERKTYSSKNGNEIEVKRGYHRLVPYIESMQGGDTMSQALRIKELFYDFDADYCVLDTRNGGIAILDMLCTVLYDENRDTEYEAWTTMNNENYANRINVSNAKSVIYSVNANEKLNSDIAISMRSVLENKQIDLLINLDTAKERILNKIDDYKTNLDLNTQLFYEKPYIETRSAINEMVALEYERREQTGSIKIYEVGRRRKDRYTSMSYGNYFIAQLEKDLLSDDDEYTFTPLCN